MLSSKKINYNLIAKVLAGEATSSEVRLHEQWLAENPKHKEELDEMVEAWTVATDALPVQDVDVDNAWRKIRQQMNANIQIVWYKRLVYQRVAAAILVLFTIASAIYLLNPVNKIEYQEIVVYSQIGEDVNLPDGSIVSLSAESKISYSSPFKPDNRSVSFSGEAFFKIEGNPKWPFVIETDDLTIKVTGTAFNVRSWPNQPWCYVDVSHGSVNVSFKTDSINTIQLIEGMRAAYNRKSKLLEKTIADPNFLSWKTRRIEFQNTSLSQVFETLENVYKVKIVVSDASILEERMGATFSHNSLDYVTNVVCVTFDLVVFKDNNILYFTRKKS